MFHLIARSKVHIGEFCYSSSVKESSLISALINKTGFTVNHLITCITKVISGQKLKYLFESQIKWSIHTRVAHLGGVSFIMRRTVWSITLQVSFLIFFNQRDQHVQTALASFTMWIRRVCVWDRNICTTKMTPPLKMKFLFERQLIWEDKTDIFCFELCRTQLVQAT